MISEAEPAGTRYSTVVAFEATGRGLTCVTFSLHVAHPDDGCLPLPVLQVPHSIDGLKSYAADIEATLWQDAHNWAPAWTRSLTRCTHGLNPYGVSTAFTLIQAWRALVSRAADYAAGHQSQDAYSLDRRLILLHEAGRNLTALGAGHHG
jgi:hypothetical protein